MLHSSVPSIKVAAFPKYLFPSKVAVVNKGKKNIQFLNFFNYKLKKIKKKIKKKMFLQNLQKIISKEM
jgi:hypothetical protein